MLSGELHLRLEIAQAVSLALVTVALLLVIPSAKRLVRQLRLQITTQTTLGVHYQVSNKIECNRFYFLFACVNN